MTKLILLSIHQEDTAGEIYKLYVLETSFCTAKLVYTKINQKRFFWLF